MKRTLGSALILGSLITSMVVAQAKPSSGSKEGQVKVGDITVGYQIYGSGYPLVMIMGSASTMKMWESGLIQALSSIYQLILLDNRGIGNTDAGMVPFSIGQFADDTAGLMDALGIKQAHVLGWSMGALIAEELVLRHPEKVNKLVLYAAYSTYAMFPPAPEIIQQITDTTGTPEEQGMRYIAVLFSPGWMKQNGERIKEIFYRPLGEMPPNTLWQQSMAIDQWEGCTDRLGTIGKKVLVIAGSDDALVPVQNSGFLASAILHADLSVIEGGGHGLMFQFPEVFAGKVLQFLE